MTESARFDRPGGAPSRLDRLASGTILVLGALMVGLTVRADDFFTGDATYFELARSLIVERTYGFDAQPSVLPPGFPALLALACVAFSCRYMVLIKTVAAGAALGLLVSYKLLRREAGALFAGIVCLLLASSPSLFKFSTRMVFSDMPYFFTSVATLVVAGTFATAKGRRARVGLGVLCAGLLVVSILLRSAGVTLVVGLVGWLAASWWADRAEAPRRLKMFVPLVLAGVMTQVAWTHWAPHPPLDWPEVAGYPQPYLAQLAIKSGNRPEVGPASVRDIPARVARNLGQRLDFLLALLTHLRAGRLRWLVPGLAAIMLCGLWISLRRGGGSWAAWYFLAHEAMYLVWPWNFEDRFMLPVAPLACLYGWRGAEAALGGLSRTAWGARIRRRLSPSLTATSVWGNPLTVGTLAGTLVLVVLVGLGVARELQAGRENVRFDVAQEATYPDVEAGRWVGSHTPATTVVMARQLDVVFHYARRRVVWFPPVSNPQQLMDGIRHHGVEYVVVTDRAKSYWLPPEEKCFDELTRAYPGRFRLVHEEPRLRIFRVSDGS
jgi:hypothetical protein